MPCAKTMPPCGREGCGDCEGRSLFARKAELEARGISCMLSDADMRKTSGNTPRIIVAWMCMACYHAWEAPPSNVVFGGSGCPYCSENCTAEPCGYEDCKDCAARSLFAWKDALSERGIACGLSDDMMLRTAGSSTFYVPWTCARSKHTWEAPPYNVCTGGRCCGYCKGAMKPPCGSDACDMCMVRSLYMCKVGLAGRRIASMLDDDAMKSTARGQGSPKLPWRCLECENEWKAVAGHVIGNKRGCPVCNRPGATEKTVHEAVRAMDLGDFDIVVDGEWMPDGGVYGNARYRFDLRVNVFEDDERARFFVVEVDGEQHFGPWNLDRVGDDHATRLRRDVEKMVWAFERGIPIVRAPTCKVAFGGTERDADWVAKLTELCREALDWRPIDDDHDYPLFLYPGSEWLYSQHIDELERVLSERASKRIRIV